MHAAALRQAGLDLARTTLATAPADAADAYGVHPTPAPQYPRDYATAHPDTILPPEAEATPAAGGGETAGAVALLRQAAGAFSHLSTRVLPLAAMAAAAAGKDRRYEGEGEGREGERLGGGFPCHAALMGQPYQFLFRVPSSVCPTYAPLPSHNAPCMKTHTSAISLPSIAVTCPTPLSLTLLLHTPASAPSRATATVPELRPEVAGALCCLCLAEAQTVATARACIRGVSDATLAGLEAGEYWDQRHCRVFGCADCTLGCLGWWYVLIYGA